MKPPQVIRITRKLTFMAPPSHPIEPSAPTTGLETVMGRARKRPGVPRGGFTLLGLCALGVVASCVHQPTGAAPTTYCIAAESHLSTVEDMATVVEPDTIEDWRTDQTVLGCRVTAAGVTTMSLRGRARTFFDTLRESGWTRTPDPQDAPGESSLRLRHEGVDCLFSFYSDGLLGTDAEFEVDDLRVPTGNQQRFNFLVQCQPAAESAG